MSDPSIKKRNKKRKRKGKGSGSEAGAATLPPEDQTNGGDKTPKQASDVSEEPVITTTKCHRCKGSFRQMVQNGGTASSIQQANWMCPSCVQAVKAEEDKQKQRVNFTDGGGGGCNCAACVAKRENAVTPQVERDAHITQTYWMEIRHIVKKIYREKLSLANPTHKASIGSEKMKMIVKKLCNRDPHQFFQRLETLAREYLLEVKVRLLEQLSCGFNSPQLAIEFIQMLLEEYSNLCKSLPSLLYLLEPLEECDYVQKLGMTVELMNKNIFRELIFAESFMSSNLPLIIAQLRLASLSSDLYHRTTADNLSKRYATLDHEMDDISRIWKAAKEHLNHQQDAHRKMIERRAQIKIDGESFKQRQAAASGRSKELGTTSSIAQSKEKERKKSSESIAKQSSSSNNETSVKSNSHSTNGRSHSVSGLISSSEGVTREKALEWSGALFKCIKPVGEPEFRLNGDIVTHTITLHVDMTSLDLSDTKAKCKRHELKKYRRLGLSVEEVVEVSMKLNALKSLGIHLDIEDLFDDEGFSLTDINETLVGEEVIQQQDEVYFLDSDDDTTSRKSKPDVGGADRVELSLEEEIDLQRARQMILLRQETTNGRNKQQDFLQGITMKIRFMKRLTVEDLDKNFVADGGRVIFNSCDQVQMKLTQLELSSTRLNASAQCVGDDLGLEVDGIHDDTPPIKRLNCDGCTTDDYLFVHTDSHKEFMQLLLEKRKRLESVVTAKLKEKGRQPVEDLPRYQVKDTQESVSSGSSGVASGDVRSSSSQSAVETSSQTGGVTSDNGPIGVMNFKPIYLSNSTQACHCSACVGAVAANVHPSYRLPLNPTDPNSGSVMIECGISAMVGGVIGGGAKLPATIGPSVEPETKEKTAKKSMTTPLSKEGLWQNWMSTSGSAQLESSSGSSAHHHPRHNCHSENGDHSNCQEGSSKPSCTISCDCHGNHGTSSTHSSATSSAYRSSCSTDHNHSSNSSSTAGDHGHVHHGSEGGGAGDGSGSGSGEVSRRYCPCCYCELFGHNGPPTAPTSHNYTKRRDKMRAKLDEKKRKEHVGKAVQPISRPAVGVACQSEECMDISSPAPNAVPQTSVEELLAFIEGDEADGGSGGGGGVIVVDSGPASSGGGGGGGGGKSAGKKGKKKSKKPQSGGVANYHGNETTTSNVVHQNGIDAGSKVTNSSDAGQSLTRGGSGKNAKQSNGTSQTNKKTKKVPPELSGKRSSNQQTKLPKSDVDSEDEATPISDFDDYDDELEEFKKFCFASAPVGTRKKIAVSVDMNDIMSKIK